MDEHADVFVEKPGLCYEGVHEIHVTSDLKPQRLKAYKVPELLKPEVARQLQELLDMGFICKSTSAMASPIVCVLNGRNGENGIGYVATTAIQIKRMWANAQPDGRPAEHRWRPLFNAAKLG